MIYVRKCVVLYVVQCDVRFSAVMVRRIYENRQVNNQGEESEQAN